MLLELYDVRKEIQLTGGGSAHGLAAVWPLAANGVQKAIAFASRAMTLAERNYSPLEKEALTIVFGISNFHEYLHRCDFSVITDH